MYKILSRAITILAAILISIPVFSQKNTALLSGKLINYESEVVIADYSDLADFHTASRNMKIATDSLGRFAVKLQLDKPGYYKFGWNILYLTPGDNLTINADAKKAVSETIFTGKGAAANDYLKGNVHTNMGSYIGGGNNIFPTAQQTYDYIIKAAAQRSAQLKALKGVSADFKHLEASRIKADVLISFQYLQIYVKYAKTITDKDAYSRTFKKISGPVRSKYTSELIDPYFLQVSNFRDIVQEIVKEAPESDKKAALNEFIRAERIAYGMKKEFDRNNLISFRPKIDSLTKKTYRLSLQKYLEDLMRFGKGDLAIDFKAQDISGKPVLLSELKGKIIYIDFWATWCGPCLKEMPSLELLKEKYKNNEQLVFLSVSIDEKRSTDAWRANVKSRGAGGYQWQVGADQLADYQVSEIPRAILIDKSFKIVDMKAPSPSQKSLELAINTLLDN